MTRAALLLLSALLLVSCVDDIGTESHESVTPRRAVALEVAADLCTLYQRCWSDEPDPGGFERSFESFDSCVVEKADYFCAFRNSRCEDSDVDEATIRCLETSRLAFQDCLAPVDISCAGIFRR